MTEGGEMRRGMVELSKDGHTIFRANVGTGWASSAPPIKATRPMQVMLMPGDVLLRAARPFSSGLPPGFGDTFGFTYDVRPFFIEWKSASGRLRPEQKAFIAAMQARGALAGVARSVDEAKNILAG